jgi:hypothetical protein
MRGEWNELLERSVTNEFFLLWEWVYSWWSVFKEKNKKLYVLIGKTSDDRVIGIAPFYVERSRFPNIWPKKIIRFCSSLETYPDHLDIICNSHYEYYFLDEVFRYLIKHGEEWDEMRLEGIKERSIIIEYLSTENRKEIEKKLILDISPGSICPCLSIEKSFKEYTESFSRSKRRTIFRYRKHLIEGGGAEFKYAKAVEIEDGLKQLFALHSERAKRRGIKSTFQDERILMFHKNLTNGLIGSEHNKILISTINRNLIPIASLYCFEHAGKYYCYQSGVSYEGERNSAGTVILALNIEKAFDDGCKEVDFLRGDEKYKYFWTREFRRDMSLIVRKNDLIGRLSTVTNRFYLGIKDLVKTAVNYGSNPISERENHRLKEEGEREVEEDPH